MLKAIFNRLTARFAKKQTNDAGQEVNLPVEWKDLTQHAVKKSELIARDAVQWVDKSIHYIAMKDSHTDDEVLNYARGPIAFGVWVLIFTFGFFGIWSVTAKLDSAAIARGMVVLDDNRKTIQHLEGGIIEEIPVKEGQAVKAGDVLLKLNTTNAKARLELVQAQLFSARAAEARLIAERDDLTDIPFNEEVLKAAEENPEIRSIVESQRRLFSARQGALKGQIDIFNQRIAQFGDQITGLEAQEKAVRSQLALINEEVGVVQQLLKNGNANRPRLLALQRNAAELSGNQGEYLSLISKARQSITESQLNISNAKNDFLNKTVAELKETQVQLADLEERRRAMKDVMERTDILAPQSGIVTDLQYHTKGGVIAPGAKIMDIIPQDDKLIIEAHVRPQDIDIVRPELPARVRLTAFKSRNTPLLKGEVIQVSPDRFTDQRTNEAFYKARIMVDQKQLHSLKHVELYPGMPADVLIVTGSRTFMSYLTSPLTDVFVNAFREQ